MALGVIIYANAILYMCVKDLPIFAISNIDLEICQMMAVLICHIL
jgi:hypothetical protein